MKGQKQKLCLNILLSLKKKQNQIDKARVKKCTLHPAQCKGTLFIASHHVQIYFWRQKRSMWQGQKLIFHPTMLANIPKKESLSKHRLGLIPGLLWANITTKKTKMSKTQISSPTQHIIQLRIVCPPAYPKHNSITYSVSHRNYIKHRRHLVHSVTILGSAPTVHMDSPLCTYYFPNSVTHVESVYFTG